MAHLLTLLSFLFVMPAFAQSESISGIQIKENVKKPVVKSSRLKIQKAFTINPIISEGSGLVAWNGKLWTHNDSGAPALFALDTLTGQLENTYTLPGMENKDWEDLSHDARYFYLGAIGNNSHTRDTLQILRIEKQSLLEQKPVIDTIIFTWPKTINRGRVKKVNFDCEAMAVINDSLYLFTKEWKNGRRTRMFRLPKIPGVYTAQYVATFNTSVVVTGASYNPDKKQLVLCGYSLLLYPFLLVFEEGRSSDFFSGKVKKLKINKSFRQAEGITTFDGKNYFIINENWQLLFLHTQQQLHRLKLE